MKRTVSLAILLAFILAFAVSCGGKEDSGTEGVQTNEAETTGELEVKNPLDDDLPEINMNGYKFRMYSRTTDSIHGNMEAEEINGEELNDSIYERNRQIEARFNMEFSEVTNPDNTDAARKAVKAGDDLYEIITTRCIAAFQYAQEGMLYSINDLPYIDLDKPYWDSNLSDVLTVMNKRYFAIGDLNLTAYDFTDVMLFNKNMITDLGLDSPYELVNSGNWTLDKFNELALNASSDMDGDGKYGNKDRYGYLSSPKHVLPAFWIGAGAISIKKNNDDLPYFSLSGDEHFINVIQKIFESVHDNNVWFKNTEGANVSTATMNMFKNGQSLFSHSTFYFVEKMRDMETDFGIIPYPKYDENQQTYYSRVNFFDTFTVPVTNQNLEYTSIIIEALASASAKSVIPVYYDIALKSKISRDSDSEEMLDIIFKNRTMDLGDTVYTDQVRDGVFSSMFSNNNRNLVSKLESMENVTMKAINKTIDAFDVLD